MNSLRLRLGACFNLIKPGRPLHTAKLLTAKVFVDHENNFAHNVLKRNRLNNLLRQLEYSVPEINPKFDVYSDGWQQLDSGAELLDYFRHIVDYCKTNKLCISDDRFDRFVDYFTNFCFEFTDDQLLESIKLLKHIPQTSNVNTKNYAELWNALDNASTERIPSWDIDKILYVCDHWYHLNLGRISKFTWNAHKKLGRKVRKLAPNHLLHTMFYCNLIRKPVIDMIDFELNLINCISQLTLDEIGLMCMGFFKTQTTIRSNELISILYRRLMAELDTVEDITMVNILKTLRYSSRIAHAEDMYKVLDKISPEISRFNLLSCLHILLLGSDIQVCHLKSIEIILNRFYNELAECRLKDLERVSFVIGLYNIKTETAIEDKLCVNILKELKNRIPEIVKYPKCYSSCLYYITQKGFHDDELISNALDLEFLKLAYGQHLELKREIFCLDSYTRINIKDTYDGIRISEKYRQTMGKLLSHFIPSRDGKFKNNVTEIFLLEMFESCESLKCNPKFAHVLPHYDRPDIIVAMNKITKTSIDISGHFPEYYSGEILTKDVLLQNEQNKDDIELINIIIGGWNNFIRNEDKLMGMLNMKVEQSKLIGFTPLVFPWFEWSKLTAQEKIVYTDHKIKMALN